MNLSISLKRKIFPGKRRIARYTYEESSVSPYTPIHMPNNHPSQKHFLPYKRAERFVGNLNRLFNRKQLGIKVYDLAIKKRLDFRSETPSEHSPYKPSYLPKRRLSPNLESQMRLIRRYSSLGEQTSSNESTKKIQKKRNYTRRNKSDIFRKRNSYHIFVSEVPFKIEDEIISSKQLSTNRSNISVHSDLLKVKSIS